MQALCARGRVAHVLGAAHGVGDGSGQSSFFTASKGRQRQVKATQELKQWRGLASESSFRDLLCLFD